MLRFSSLLIFLAAFQMLDANEPLAPAEADAIIAAREAAKAERKAARKAELERAEIISEGQGVLPDGRKVIVREVVPPNLPASTLTSHQPVPAGFTAEQLDLMGQQQQLQPHKVQMLSCTVYDRSLTQVLWCGRRGENGLERAV